MTKRTRIAVGVLLLLAAAFALIAALRQRTGEVRYITAVVDRGDVVEVVGATGTLQAVTTVQVGSQVSGTIQNMYADFNSQVKKGQVIARLDPSSFEAKLGQAKANLISARANVDRQQAAVVDAKQKYDRARELADEQLLPQSDLESAKAAYDGAVAQLKANQAAVSQADANVNQAQVDLDHTIINTPIDGVVINRSVDVGQTVAASFQAPVLFIIANDLTRMQVNASIDEADIGRVAQGQDVSFRVDAFPERTFAGRVEQVRLQPTSVQNVVSYNTIISVDNPELKLMPGMTATVSVVVRKAENVLRVPAAALRFRPEGFDMQQWIESQRTVARGGGEAAPSTDAAPDKAAEGPQGAAGDGAGGDRPRLNRGGGPGGGAGGPGGAGGAGGGAPGGGGPGMGGPGGMRGMGGGGMRGAGGRGGANRGPSVVFLLDEKGVPQPKAVRLGLSDGQRTEVRDGLDEGMAVVTGVDTGAKSAPGARPSGSPSTNPFQPQGGFQQRRRQ